MVEDKDVTDELFDEIEAEQAANQVKEIEEPEIAKCAGCDHPGIVNQYINDDAMIKRPLKVGVGADIRFWVECPDGRHRTKLCKNRSIERQPERLQESRGAAVKVWNDEQARLGERKKEISARRESETKTAKSGKPAEVAQGTNNKDKNGNQSVRVTTPQHGTTQSS